MLRKTLNIIVVVLFAVLFNNISAQSITVISGIAKGAAGKKIRLLTYEDQVSCKTIELASTLADTAGKFDLSVNISHTCFATLHIDEYVADLYIKPSQNFFIEIEPEKYNEGVAILFKPQYLNINFPKADFDDINLLIYDFEVLYSDFVEKNFLNIYLNYDKTIVDSFSTVITKRYESINDEFFLDIVKYKLAALEFVSRKIGKTGIFKKYFNPEHIKYNNPGYMEFFITYFESYAGHATGQISATALNNAVNIEKKYLAVFNAFGADSLLQHEILRELAILVALKNMYYSQYYDRSAIKGILNEIKEKSKINEHQIIASNLLTVFSKRQKGTSAAYFNLQNQKEQFISLDDFKGKFIYLTFWNSQCIDCESEFELISKVVDKFKDNLEVVSISTDKHFLNMQYFLKNKNYNWNFLHFNGNYELLEQYQIKTVPFYILIDPNGNIAEYPAKEPIYNLDAYFSKIISGKNNE